jgi:hypothetical protein
MQINRMGPLSTTLQDLLRPASFYKVGHANAEPCPDQAETTLDSVAHSDAPGGNNETVRNDHDPAENLLALNVWEHPEHSEHPLPDVGVVPVQSELTMDKDQYADQVAGFILEGWS